MVVQKGKEAGGTSLRPSDAVEGGGLLDNVDVTWEEVRFEMWDYNGTQQPSPALKVGMKLEDGDKADQFFSCGKAEDWAPSKDGTKLVPIGGARGLNKSSNFMILLDSLIKAGFPEDKIGDECTVLEGLECHMVRVPAPKRPGLAPAKARADGRTYERTNFVVDVIHKLPWDKKGSGKGKTDEVADDALAEKTANTIIEILKSNKKGLTKQKMAGQVFNALKADKSVDGMAAAQLTNKDDFLTEQAILGNWSFENGVISPA